jgi:hypothetical protein
MVIGEERAEYSLKIVLIITGPVICHGIYYGCCDTGSRKRLWGLSILGDFWD